MAGNVRRLAASQELAHRRVDGRRVAGRHQEAGNLRASQRRAGLGSERLGAFVDRHPKFAESGDDQSEPDLA